MQLGLEKQGARSFAVKLEGRVVICSEFIINDLIFLRLAPGNDDKIEEVTKIINAQSNVFTKSYIIILPSYVDVVRTTAALPIPEFVPCPVCGGTMRTVNSDEYHCFNCGNAKSKIGPHINRIINMAGKGDS